MAVPRTLLTWPPGAPATRFNILRRAIYCGGVVRCVHDDIKCCCGGQDVCCCFKFDQSPPLFPLELEVIETGETQGFPPDESATCCRVWNSQAVVPIVQWQWPGCGPSLTTFLMCCPEPRQTKEDCFKLELTATHQASGCTNVTPRTRNPSSCSCGDENNPFWAQFGPFALNEDFPGACPCTGPYPLNMNVEVREIWPPAGTLSFAENLAKSDRDSLLKRDQFPDDLPEDVLKWLGGQELS